MKKMILKENNLMKIMNNFLISLPTPLNISMWWNFGSLLGLCLMIQILSGLFLSMHYCANILMAFNSIIHIIQDVNYGWMIRLIHMNGASFFFICMFLHIGRSLYYNSYILLKPWFSGILIFLLSMGTAFMGYVLPWGQMSFWGATVITNLISAIPYLGNSMVNWLWGGFSINNATLNRFYTFHFMMPFIILMLVILHLIFLHELGSSNPLGINSNYNKIIFNPYFSIKDILGFLMMLLMLLMLCLMEPYKLGDSENFNEANPMITPIHIQPEWYFLFAYAILRSIPNKLGGVIALLMSILILLILMMFNYKIKGNNMDYLSQLIFWMFISVFLLLSWIGSCSVELPFVFIGQMLSLIYFFYFLSKPFIKNYFFYNFI